MRQYPIGIQDFASIIKDDFVYVDKTALVYQLASVKGVYFLSRPRRFGKSLLVSTLKYYFQGRKDLFKGLQMEELEKDWTEYPVFEIDFNGKDYTEVDSLKRTFDNSIGTWEGIYGKSPYATELGDRFAYVLHQAHEKTGKPCVVLIDEYDKPMLDVMDTGLRTTEGGVEMTLEERNRNTLKAFYSTFKAADADLRFVFLTGVTKFAQVSVFSGFNNAQDISMDFDYETLCGISQEELDTYFHDSIADLAKANDMTFEEASRLLKETYDGYHFSRRMTDMYNPFSLLNTFKKRDFSDYWFATGTPTYLLRLLAHGQEDLSQIVGKEYSPEEFVDYRATVEAPVPMIYQSGYLTIKGYDRRRNRYRLDLPNKEVSNGFLTLVAGNYFRDTNGSRTSSWVVDAAIALEDGQIDKFHDMLVDFIASIPFNVRVDNTKKSYEKEFHLVVFLLIRLIASQDFILLNEKPSSDGIADLVLETPNNIYIFEFKLDHPASEALAQIDEKGYAAPYAHDPRKLYRIGCSFSSETGRVADWEVR
jgi:hypothetical protein